MIPADALGIGDDPNWRRRFDWYLGVADNRIPAKFRLAASIPIDFEPAAAPTADLRKHLAAVTTTHGDFCRSAFDGKGAPLATGEPSLLSLEHRAFNLQRILHL